MNVDIPPELKSFLDEELKSGRTPHAVIAEALRLLKRDREEAIAGIKDGLESLERGEGIPLDEAFHKIRAEFDIPSGK